MMKHAQMSVRGALSRGARVAFAVVTIAAGCGPSDSSENVGSASQAVVISLTGSNFQIDDDANLRVDAASQTLDWANVQEIRKQDTPSGSNDDSFGQGAKEDTAEPAIVTGGIPPNKSDLKFFGVYQEGTSGSGFLNMFWSRVQDPSGTTNMDFELNKLQCNPGGPAPTNCSSNGVTPLRSSGDLLITYDLANGGTNPILSLRTWSGSSWGAAVNLTTSNKATGSINTSPIPAAESDGLGALDPRTFGEAQVALSAIFPSNTCASFGSAYLKSRSSDSFTAALKDFVPPVPVSITNCGRVVVLKTDGVNPLPGAQFTISPPSSATPPSSAPTAVAPPAPNSVVFCFDNLLIGTQYTIHESVTPPGFDPAADQLFTPATQGICAGITANTPPDLTFMNIAQKGAILVTKLRKHAASGSGNHPEAGVDFVVNGVTVTTDANGQACFGNLPFGNYTVHEIVPAGYVGEGDKVVTVDNKATCGATPYLGETVTFVNTPLSDITVSFSPQVAGGTAARISCTGLDTSPPDATPNAFDDTSKTFTGLVPNTYNCTIVIDP